MAKKATTSTDNDAKLKVLNDLREKLGMRPTQTSVKLDERIATLRKQVDEIKDTKVAKGMAILKEVIDDEDAKARKKAKKANVVEIADEPNGKASSGDLVLLGDLCKRLEVDPRAARIRLRKAGSKVPKTQGDSWRWAAKDVAAVSAIIAPSKAAS